MIHLSLTFNDVLQQFYKNYTQMAHFYDIIFALLFAKGRYYIMKELKIAKNDANQRLDRFVGKAVPLLPDTLLQKYIRLKRIKLNSKGAKRDTRLSEGDIIQLYINDEFFDSPTEENAYLKISTPKVEIIYEDENIFLADKAPGVLCHAAGGDASNTLIANIQALFYARGEWKPREENSFAPALCNRIDRNTGGIVIAAKNAETLRIINEKIKLREIEKFYLCAVSGIPNPESGEVRSFIFKDAVKNQVYVRQDFCPGAKEAVTRYRTLMSRGELSLVECELLTGRTHQIRAQMASIGVPLLGDGKYGSEKTNRSFGEKGQALYSYKLHFAFKTDAGILNYLNGKAFEAPSVPFAKKIFDFFVDN